MRVQPRPRARRLALVGGLVALLGGLLVACGPSGPAPAAPVAPAPASASPVAAAPAATTAPVATADPPATPVPLEKVSIAYPAPSMGQMALVVARDHGFFERNGLVAETPLITTDRAMAAVAAGQISYFAGIGPATVAASALGVPLRGVWTAATGPTYVIFTRPDIRTPEELRGQRMGVPSLGGTAVVAAGLALKQYGIETGRDVVLLQLEGDPLVLESLRSGVIDAATLSPPLSLAARRDGFTPLVNVAAMVQIPVGGLSATLDKLTTERDQVHRMVRALTQAQQWLLENREEAIAITQATLSLDPAIAAGTYDETLPTLQGKGLVSREGVNNVLQIVRDAGRIGPDVRYEDVADGSLAEDVARELGLIP
jgi:NitT/TauT family transport system substrate-binding protein